MGSALGCFPAGRQREEKIFWLKHNREKNTQIICMCHYSYRASTRLKKNTEHYPRAPPCAPVSDFQHRRFICPQTGILLRVPVITLGKQA